MAEQFANKATTTLNGAIDDNDTSLVVTSATGFPTSGDFRIVVSPGTANEEIMTVTAVSGTTFTISRATEVIAGVQTAFSHSNGATISHVLTAGALANFALPTGAIGASAWNSTTQSINNGVETAITLDTEKFDTDGFHSVSSNTSRMTIPTGLEGRYLVIATIGFDPVNTTGRRKASLRKNNSPIEGTASEGVPNATVYNALQTSAIIDLIATDYVEAFAYQESGAALNVGSTTGTRSRLEIYKLDSGRVGTGIGARAIPSGVTSLDNSVWTSIALAGTDRFDTSGFHNPASNNTRMTIPTGLGGKYDIKGQIQFAANATGMRFARILLNGATSLSIMGPLGGDAVTTTRIAISTTYDLIAGDYVELQGFQGSGGSLNTVDGDTHFSIMRLDSLPPTAQGQWQDYTPALTNGSVGNGTLLGKWKYLDNKTIILSVSWVFGSTSSISGSLSVGLPSGITSAASRLQVIPGLVRDSGTAWYMTMGRIAGSATTVGTFAVDGGLAITTTVPMTWTTNDELMFEGTIEIA